MNIFQKFPANLLALPTTYRHKVFASCTHVQMPGTMFSILVSTYKRLAQCFRLLYAPTNVSHIVFSLCRNVQRPGTIILACVFMYKQRTRISSCIYDITKNSFFQCHGKNIIFNARKKLRPLNTHPNISFTQKVGLHTQLMRY